MHDLYMFNIHNLIIIHTKNKYTIKFPKLYLNMQLKQNPFIIASSFFVFQLDILVCMLGFNDFIDNIIHKNFTILTFIDSIFIFRGCIHDCLHKNITNNYQRVEFKV